MKKITNLSAVLMDMDGIRPLKPDGSNLLTIRSALAQCLGRAQSPNPIQAMVVALSLHNTRENTLELEDADFNLLKECVSVDRGYTNIIKGPLIQCLDAAETPLESKKEGTKG